MTYIVGSAVVTAVTLLVLSLLWRNPIPSAIASLQSDETRLAQISGSGSASDGLHTLFQKVKLNNNDVKIIRRDVRRAMAAYPDVKEDDLLEGRWFAFDEAARVPSKGFWNSHGTQDPITQEWYLESAYMSVVRSAYPNRADDVATDAFFAERKAKRRADRLARLQDSGPFASWGGSGGSMSVRLDKPTGNVIVTRAKEWAAKGQRWTFPFVPDEWADVNESDLEAIKNLPSFAKAIEDEIDVRPSGVSISYPTQSGVLMPGESAAVSFPAQPR